MGNQIQKCIKKDRVRFIKCTQILKQAQRNPKQMEKVFGQTQEGKSKTRSLMLEESVVIRKEKISQGQTIEEQPSVSDSSDDEVDAARHQIMESIQEMAAKYLNEKFSSFNCSPIKEQTEGKQRKTNEQASCQRLRHHYFRLKGCEVHTN